MSNDASSLQTLREAERFCRYLSGRPASPYVIAKFVEGIPAESAHGGVGDALDRWLLSLARSSSVLAGMADAYAAIFRPHSRLRRHLVLMLAILENAPGFHEDVDAAREGRPITIIPELAVTAALALLRLIGGIVLCAPVHLLAARSRADRA